MQYWMPNAECRIGLHSFKAARASRVVRAERAASVALVIPRPAVPRRDLVSDLSKKRDTGESAQCVHKPR